MSSDSFFYLAVKKFLYVVFHVVDTGNTEVVDENFCHVR